ncbi:4307_t:CDS:2, partial [Paraglomus occultum]
NKRSLDVLKETVVEHNGASGILADFAHDGKDVKKRRKQYHQLDGNTTPCPGSPIILIHPLEEENPFIEEETDIIIDDVPCEFSFKNGDPVDDLHMGETNVSLIFRNYQKQSLNIARDKGLFVESNVQEILSLSSILLLASNSYSNTMTDHFGLSLLDEIHQKFKSEQQIILILDSNSETTFRKAVEMALSGSRDDAISWLCDKLGSEQSLKENLGFIILDCLRTLPSSKIRNEHSEITHYTNFLDRIMKGLFDDPDKHIVQWPNTALNESKTRKAEGRAKQPDFTVSVICQLQTSVTLLVGEVSPPSKRGDVYKNCNDLIRLGVFMKDILDSSIDKGADIKVLGFQCVDYKVDYYTMDLVQGIYIMIHIGQMSVPASLKDMSSFVDDIELSLGITEVISENDCRLESEEFDEISLCWSDPPINNLDKGMSLIDFALSVVNILPTDSKIPTPFLSSLWNNRHGLPAYYAVMDAFMTDGLHHKRRDEDLRCVFHFVTVNELSPYATMFVTSSQMLSSLITNPRTQPVGSYAKWE